MGGQTSIPIPGENFTGELVSGYYQFDGDEKPLPVEISGNRRLDVTIIGDDLSISVDGTGHRISLIGTNNKVKVSGKVTYFRVEGSPNEVVVGEGCEIGVYKSYGTVFDFSEGTGGTLNQLTSADAPPILPTSGPAEEDGQKVVLYAYRDRPGEDEAGRSASVHVGGKRLLEDEELKDDDVSKRQKLDNNSDDDYDSDSDDEASDL